jgi:ABC-type histidine transport system ATPase subunit
MLPAPYRSSRYCIWADKGAANKSKVAKGRTKQAVLFMSDHLSSGTRVQREISGTPVRDLNGPRLICKSQPQSGAQINLSTHIGLAVRNISFPTTLDGGNTQNGAMISM